MARSNTKRVFLPQDMNIPMPASQEYPGGRVVQLKAGWCDLDEGMAVHPILSRLQVQLPDEAERDEALFEAQREYNEAVAAAAKKLAEVRSEIGGKHRESMLKATEDYVSRREEALAKNLSFNEPHPDLETRRAMSLTAPAGSFSTLSPASFGASVANNPEVATAHEDRPRLPSEEDNRRTMRAAGHAQTPHGRAVINEREGKKD